MTAESVSQWFQRVAELPGHDASGGPPREALRRIESALQPFLALSLEAFAELLGKVKKPKAPPKPKKTDAEKLAEKQRKADEAGRLKADKARNAAEAKRVKAEEADRVKAGKAAEKLAQKGRDAEAARLRKEAQKAEVTAAEERTAATVAQELQSLIATFNGDATKTSVEAGIASLKPLTKSQLLLVAKHLNADAGLTESSGKPKSMKALEGRLWRLWKTSQNIRH